MFISIIFIFLGCENNSIGSIFEEEESDTSCIVDGELPAFPEYAIKKLTGLPSDLSSSYEINVLLDSVIYLMETSDQYRLLKSNNRGDTWSIIDAFPFASDMEFGNRQYGLITLSDSTSFNFSNSFMYTEDYGDNWENIFINTKGYLFSPRFEYYRGFVFKCLDENGFFILRYEINDFANILDTIDYENLTNYRYRNFVSSNKLFYKGENLVSLETDSIISYRKNLSDFYSQSKSVSVDYEGIISLNFVFSNDGFDGYYYHAVYENSIFINGSDESVLRNIEKPFLYLGSDADTHGLFIGEVDECDSQSSYGTAIYRFSLYFENERLSDSFGSLKIKKIKKVISSDHGGRVGSYIIDSDEGIYYLYQN